MADKKITLDIAINTADSATSLKELKTSIKELKNAALEFGDGSDEFLKATEKAGELQDKINGLNDSFKNLSNSPIENISNSFRTLKGQIANLDFGGAKQSLKDLGSSTLGFAKSILGIAPGVKTATIAFRGLGAAIAATGIGLFVAAIAVVVSKFDEIKASGGALGKVFNFIGDTVKLLTDKMLSLLDFFGLVDKAAIDSAENVKKLNEEAEKDLKNQQQLYDLTADKYAESTQKKFQADLDYKAKKLEINKDETLSAEEKEKRIALAAEQRTRKILAVDAERAAKLKEIQDKADQEAIKKEAEKQKKLEDIANKKAIADFAATQKLQENAETQNSIQEEFLKSQSEIDAIYAQIAQEGRLKTSEQIYAEITKRLQAEQDAAIKRSQIETSANEQLKTNIQLQTDIENEFKLSQSEVDAQYEAIAQEGRLKTSEEIYAEIAKRQKARQDAAAQELIDEKRLQDGIVQTTQNGLIIISNLTELFAGKSRKEQEKAFKIQKSLAISSGIIDTYKSAVSSYNALSGIPVVGPALGAIAAAAAITAGLLNVKKIKEQKFDSGGSSSGGGGSTSVPNFGGGGGPTGVNTNSVIPQTPTGVTLFGQNNNTNNLGTPASPIQAYVVESQISDTQARLLAFRTRSEIR